MSLSSSYNVVDRALHYLAFSAPFVHKALCDLENDLFKRELEGVRSEHEVFITGLPRAGTTLLLELLYGTGEFETFTYRHMPFVLAPMIWDGIARTHRKPGTQVERAHADGMSVSFDSPEAFEEIVWLAHLKKALVHEHTLTPLMPDMITEDCAAAIRDTVRKLLALSARRDEAARCEESAPHGKALRRGRYARPGTAARYLSKNNANLSRIEVLTELFPTSTLLIAFREPAAHVSSLLTQHRRFSREHAHDTFSKRYMEWIGHYEFGANLKPINFEGWLDGNAVPSAPDAGFWMRYWTAAYRYALEHRTRNVRFVDFDKLLEEGERYLDRLADAIGLEDSSALASGSTTLRAPTTRPVGAASCAPEVWRAARDVHSRLRAAAL
jgi:hypothetical protein